jgi:predicted GNAT superfamily acetyltransferase
MSNEYHHLVIRRVDEKDLDSIVAPTISMRYGCEKDRVFSRFTDVQFFYVIEKEKDILGFAMVTDWNARYDSLLHRWFIERFPEFYYIDRIVIERDHRRMGLGSRLYNTLIADTRSYPLMCEVAIEPENTESLKFHEKFGFETIGEYACYGKTFKMPQITDKR